MIIQDLRNRERLTDSEQALADHILVHYEEVLQMTSRELAEKVYVSAPTVIRLCRKLGYESFTDFKVELSRETADEHFRMTHVDYNVPFKAGESDRELVRNMAGIAISSVSNTRDHLDYRMAHRICEVLKRKHYLDFYGMGHSINGAREFCEKMSHIGYVSTILSTYEEQSSRIAGSGPDQVAFLVTYSGLNKQIVWMAEPLQKKGTTVVVITGNRISPLLEHADYYLLIDSGESLVQSEKTDTFGALYSLHYLLDCLFAMVFSTNYDENLRREQEHSRTQPI